MRVVLINKSDRTGGAAVVTLRLMNALRAAGIDARMLVVEKCSDSPYIERCAGNSAIRRAFLAERLKIFLANGLSRADLFKVDTCSDGLPLWKHEWVRKADVVCLNWINQGMLSMSGIRKIIDTGKPVVWTMHDMWCLTGICHHAGDCGNYLDRCGDCRFLGSMRGSNDLSARVWRKKESLYSLDRITFVAVSRWLQRKAQASSLLGQRVPIVIPNAFPVAGQFDPAILDRKHTDGRLRIIMGAARLDDPVKGLPILVEATRALRESWPEAAERAELVTFGNIRDPHGFDGIAIPHRHLGLLRTDKEIAEAYRDADIVVSTSLYETLPGTLVEGQAWGCIPVAFDRGGQSDIVDNGRTGFLAQFDSGTAIAGANIAACIARAAEADAEEMAVEMFESVRDKFSAGAVARRYVELFNKLLS